MRYLQPRTLKGALRTGTLIAVLGCRTDEADVHRWANTQQGPRKIVAVLTHDKYPDVLRVEAAMTLVTMKARAGRKIGMDELLEGLKVLPEQKRAQVVAGMVPRLTTGMQAAPPGADAGGRRAPDTSMPYKDAALALMTSPVNLVADPAAREQLKAALMDWALADFAGRMDDSTQSFGMGQLLHEVGPVGVRRLPPLIEPEARIDALASFIAELGDAETKLAASERLVKVAQEVESDGWLKRKTPLVQAANKASGVEVEGERLTAQLARYQEEEFLRVLSSLKKVGGPPVVEYLLASASNARKSETDRAAALAALEGHVDRKNEAQVSRLLQLAGADDTPDLVRDQALRRVGELPRKQTAEALYSLFSKENWRIRWVAAELVLRTSEAEHLAEFMGKLSRVRTMAITEPIRYGKLIGELRGTPGVAQLIPRFIGPDQVAPVRLTALGYFLEYGAATDLPKIAAHEGDGMPVPPCAPNAKDCEWQCEVAQGTEQKVEAIRTVGDFVRHCVQPAMRLRAASGPTTTAAVRSDEASSPATANAAEAAKP